MADESAPQLPDAQQCLARSSHTRVRALQCAIDGTKVVITGRVPTHYLKQMAQEALLGAGFAVLNRVVVEADPPLM